MILFLNDIAGSEILLILVFILIFFGSKSIPGIARTFGRTIRQIKDASQDLQNEIKKSTQGIKDELNLKELVNETAQDIQKPMEEFANDLDESIKYDRKSNNYFVNQQNLNQVKKEEAKANIPLDQQQFEED